MARIDLACGPARATLLPGLGGRIAQCTLADDSGLPWPLFFPFDAHAHAPDAWAKGGLYPLVPFSGRIGNAQLTAHGLRFALVPHSATDPHALHGIAQRRAWRTDDAAADHARLSYEHQPDAHWPWRFHARMEVVLTPTTLTIRVSCRNTDRCTWPAGVGLHPYLRHQAGDRLAFSARACWPADAADVGLPGSPARGDFSPGKHDWDDGDFTRFYQHWRGRADLHGADGRTLRISASDSFEHVVLHKPQGQPYLCIEPATHVPNAFNLAAQGIAGTGTRDLPPGETLEGWMEFRVSGTATA